MFRNKVAVRAAPPFSPSASPFLLLQIHLDPQSPPSPLPPSTQSIPPPSLKVESLCWKLSRSLHLACFSPSPDTISIVYQKHQSKSARKAVKEIRQNLPVSTVEDEEEAEWGSLVARAVQCGLRSFLLNGGWRCVGDNCFVNSTLSSSEERKHLHALTVSTQTETDGTFLFLVSPDIVRFSRHEITSVVSSKEQKDFDSGEEIILKDCKFATSCSSLPYLTEGHVIGFRKLLPAGVDLMQYEDIWSVMHGLELTSDYFVNVQSTRWGCADTKWLPSAFVIQGAGLSPAPQSTRISEAVRALQSFLKFLGEWNFFGRGILKAKGISSLSIGLEIPVWTTKANSIQGCIAANESYATENGFISQDATTLSNLLSPQGFRAPKPALFSKASGKAPHDGVQETISSTNKNILSISGIHDGVSTRTRGARSANIKNKPTPVCQEPITEQISSVEESSTVRGRLPPVPKSRRANIRKTRNIRVSESVPEESSSDGTNNINDDVYTKNISEASQGDGLRKSETSKRKGTEISTEIQKRKPPKEENTVSKDNMEPTKKKAKTENDSSDVVSKVIDYHAKGLLESVTVVELKCFLSSRKAKVGGKKEELIQRVTALLA